jgi:hypothetical protein
MRGTSDGGGAQWQLGFGFVVKLVWRGVGEVHPNLYRCMGGV